MKNVAHPVDLIARRGAKIPPPAILGRILHGDRRPHRHPFGLRTAPCRCIIVTGGSRKNRLVAAGYNGFLPGAPHHSRVRDNHEQATVHAEQNALADAARRGSSVEGCVAYLTHYPCLNCAKLLAAAGIAEIRFRANYRNDPLVELLLAEAGVKILKLRC